MHYFFIIPGLRKANYEVRDNFFIRKHLGEK
jgi:hypothetical protein